MNPNLVKGTIGISGKKSKPPFPVSYLLELWRQQFSNLTYIVNCSSTVVKSMFFKQQQLARKNLSTFSIVLGTVLFAKEVVES